MNGGMAKRVISNPERLPAAAPSNTAVIHPKSIQSHTGSPPHLTTIAHKTPAKAINDPTERSIPPVMMIKVIPTAITPITVE